MLKYVLILLPLVILGCDQSSSTQNEVNVQPLVEESKEGENDTTFYPAGEIQTVVNYTHYPNEYTYITYFENGLKKEEGEQLDVYGCGMPGDVTKYWDSGEIESETSHAYFQLDESESCHETRIVRTTYYNHENGYLKSIEQMETCAECEECPCGDWYYYDEEGGFVRKENRGDCNDGVLDCLNE